MSSNKTANLQLNQWQAGDAFLREEFNQDNGKIDAAVQGVRDTQLRCINGSYVGDGVYPQKIPLPGKPKLLMLFGMYNYGSQTSPQRIKSSLICVEQYGIVIKDFVTSDLIIKFHEDGFEIVKPGHFNEQGLVTQYFCLL